MAVIKIGITTWTFKAFFLEGNYNRYFILQRFFTIFPISRRVKHKQMEQSDFFKKTTGNRYH